MSMDEHDNRKMHCRMLGHEITFAYCRQTGEGQPCRKILDCWFDTFDVEQFAHQYLTKEQLAAVLAPPKPKMTSIVELIQQARQTGRQ
jgi:hypothetical protein